MISQDLLSRDQDPRELADERAYIARALTVTCRLALETNPSPVSDDVRSASVATVLELVEQLLLHVEEGVELLSHVLDQRLHEERNQIPDIAGRDVAC